MPRVYPRIGDATALELLAHLREVTANSDSTESLVGFEHPSAAPVATGGSVATRAHLEELRALVVDGLSDLWTPGEEVAHGQRSELDRRLGARLHAGLDILPADAAHSGVWNFLTLVVFPDLLWARFPDLHEGRALGGLRNVLRRPWMRHHVLGDLHCQPRSPLGEDELVGLFERSALARNRRLVRALARHLLAIEPTGRSTFARKLYVRVTHETGPLLLDSLTDSQLAGLVEAAAQERTWPTSDDFVEKEDDAPEDVMAPLGRQMASGDLVLKFHREAVDLSRRIMLETSYRPQYLLAMLNEQGGVETARQVVGQLHPSSGFLALMDLGRLDLAFENLVLDEQYRGLFAEELVEIARDRMNSFRGW